MTERAQALEAAREWQAIAYGDRPETWAALDYYRERGWPVDVNTFPERARVEDRLFSFMAGYQEARRLAVQPPPPVGSPTTEIMEEAEATVIGQVLAHWFTQGGEARFGSLSMPATIGMLTATREPSNADELVSQILSRLSTPVEPAGASEPLSDLSAWLYHHPACEATPFGLPMRYVREAHHNGLCNCGLVAACAPVSPVAPEPPHVRDDYRDVWLSGWRAGRAPTGAPAPCVWRERGDSEEWDVACGWGASFIDLDWKCCPYCGSPLKVER